MQGFEHAGLHKTPQSSPSFLSFSSLSYYFPISGVSIIFKIRVFYKARFEGYEFFIRWPYAVFHKMQVVFYKSAHFMYL